MIISPFLEKMVSNLSLVIPINGILIKTVTQALENE